MKIARIQPLLMAALVLAALAMSACRTMNKDECLAVDWRTIGYEDGVAGHQGNRIGQHRKACAEHGVSPDLSLYQAGRDEGLREYCQPANGYRVGVRGGSYAGVCPADLDSGFVSAFQSGRQLYTLESRLSSVSRQLESTRRELDRVEDEIVEKSATVISDESKSEDRTQALLDTKQLAERAGRLKAEIRQLERDESRYQREIEDYRSATEFDG